MIIPPGFAHVTHIYGGVGLPEGGANTYGIAPQGGSWDPGDVEILHDLWADHIMPLLASAVTLQRTLMKYGPNNIGPVAEHVDPVNGGYNSAAAPPNVTTLVRKRTALGGRMNRGRLFLPGAPEGEIDNAGLLSAARLALYQSNVNAWKTAVDATGMRLVLLHGASSDPTDLTGLEVDVKVATQRRRLR